MDKVLIVDDSKVVIYQIQEELQRYDFIEPFIAENYKDAEEIINQYGNEIKVALLDYNLPDGPNGEVIHLANQHKIPTVVLTGTLNEKVKDVIFLKSVIDFIKKDDISSIKSAINSVIRVIKNHETTVLVVESSTTYRMLLAQMLKSIHLHVLEASDGKEALDIIEAGEHDISLVLTDYEMPVMNGLDLTYKLRENHNKDALGIIAVSAVKDEEIIRKFLKLGANDFINKPYTDNEIITKVNANLELLDLFSTMKEMAVKDYLTGSYNRRYFFDSGTAIYKKAKRANKPIAVAMLDIDKFKNINDTYGHDIGDVAIKEIKRLLDHTLRSSDLVARFGGEEYCILLENITLEDLEKLFEKVRKSFEDNIIEINKLKISYTVSIGIQYGLDDSLEDMVRLSDEALYDAKENGRNQVIIKSS